MARHPQWWDELGRRHPRIQAKLRDLAHLVKPYLTAFNFITLHYAYFIVMTLVGSVIFWGASNPARSIGYWDSLFMVTSALTAAGLNSVNLGDLSTFQQVELFVLMMLGSPILVSWATIAFRKHIFERRFEGIVEMERNKRWKETTSSVVGMTGAMFGLPVMSSFGKGPAGRAARPQPAAFRDPFGRPSSSSGRRSLEDGGHTGHQMQPLGLLTPIREGHELESQTEHAAATGFGQPTYPARSSRRKSSAAASRATAEGFNLQTFLQEQRRNIGRNGKFSDLSADQREYLGGVEYRSLKFLSVFVLVYFLLFQLFGAITLGAWMSVHAADAAAVNAQNPWWAGAFLAVSSYSNAGFTLLNAGFLPFQSSYFLLTIVTVLSLAGPAAFPAFMRLLIWAMSSLLWLCSKDEEYPLWREGFDYILKFPRRVYTSMFPARDTWMFVATFGGFVLADWALILILGIGNPTMDADPLGQRVFDALFQGFSIPSGGYAIWSPSSMYPAVLVLWLIVLYTAAYPHIITMRNTNVYEERSLGIYGGDKAEEEQLGSDDSDSNNEGDDYDGDGGSGSRSRSGSGGGGVVTDDDVEKSSESNSKTTSRYALRPTASRAPSQAPSARSAKGLYQAGLKGSAFVGQQLRRRLTSFNGVGVAPAPAGSLPPLPNPLRRARTINFAQEEGMTSTNSHAHTLRDPTPATLPPSLVSQQVRGQLSHDVWWIAATLFAIAAIETRHALEDPVTYALFNLLFEIVSGYTTVGISTGVPDQSYSLSGGFYAGSKVVMVLVMLRGRHRGLPVALDRAVRLPGVRLPAVQGEEEEGGAR
ncbi:TrkH-domain-containing protein [Xylariaceae sp. FL0804]|nr:TrkH-domain-containing protein [Xylariaceae sp. FL0804]